MYNLINTDLKFIRRLATSCGILHSARSESLYQQMSSKWWDLNGIFGPLHSMNSLRVPLIRDGILHSRAMKSDKLSQPLKGFSILDIGCGGGILCEPLARLGANVTGVDPVAESIQGARARASADFSIKDRLSYVCGSADDLQGNYDAVVASEVVEHVDDVTHFLDVSVRLTKEGGSLFVTTLNQTWLSYALGIVVAEEMLGLVPRGIHQWEKFLTPKELQFLLETCGCQVRLVHGMLYNPLNRKFSWCRDTSINYAVHAVKRIP